MPVLRLHNRTDYDYLVTDLNSVAASSYEASEFNFLTWEISIPDDEFYNDEQEIMHLISVYSADIEYT